MPRPTFTQTGFQPVQDTRRGALAHVPMPGQPLPKPVFNRCRTLFSNLLHSNIWDRYDPVSPAPIEMGFSVVGYGCSAARGLKHHAYCPAPIEMGFSHIGIGGSAARGLKHHAWCPTPIEMGFSHIGIGGSAARGLKHHAWCPAPIEMGSCTWVKRPRMLSHTH